MANNFKKVGNWGGANRLTKEIGGDISHAVGIALMRVGLETERKVVKYIQRQPMTWEPLSDEYKARKAAQGYSNLMLRRTGDYINRITSTVAPDKMSVFVGVRKGVAKKGSDQEMWQIGAILEYGTKDKTTPARPHFRPVNNLMRKKIVSKDLFGKAVWDYIKTKHSL